MPKLKSRDTHKCIVCESSFKRRSFLLEHFSLLVADGKPRCPGLRVVIRSVVWTDQILLHYKSDVPLPNLSYYMKRKPKPSGRKRVKAMEDMNNDARRKRLSSDGLLTKEKKVIYTKAQILAMLRTVEDADGMLNIEIL